MTDTKVYPGKVFATLDEHSKNIGDFLYQYGKDALQMFC